MLMRFFPNVYRFFILFGKSFRVSLCARRGNARRPFSLVVAHPTTGIHRTLCGGSRARLGKTSSIYLFVIIYMSCLFLVAMPPLD